jgi:putative CocE/NonD family hydrolase
MGNPLKWLGYGLLGLVALAVVGAAGVVGAGILLFEHHAAALVPAGYKRDTAFYITARDGTRVAVDVYLPQTLAAGQRIPALIKATPYWRARELTLLGEAMAEYLAPGLAEESDVTQLNARGYAVAVVDARGTGASFGTLKIMFSDAEIEDYGSVADWIAAQPWSNHKVGAYGFSYRGISAANIAALPNPSIKAVAPLFDLTDLYLLARPGGAYETYLLWAWSKQTRALNAGIVPCDGDTVCEWAIKGPKPVDADSGGVLLKQAIAAHAGNYNVADCVWTAPARDDALCQSGQSLSDVSLIARKAKVEARGLPIFALTGWLDESSPAQVLNRFETFSNPQEVVIGPFTHGGFENDDPFAPNRALDLPSRRQTAMMADFFDRYLKDGGTPLAASSVHYYVLGAGAWRDTPHWPPADSKMVKFYLAPQNLLSQAKPPDGLDTYIVWFPATTGALSGYRGQVDLSKTNYGDRRAEDSRLQVYTAAPVTDDTEIAGTPIAHLHMASGITEGLAIVYLEDVAPNGTVTYISQGALKLAHRKLARPGAPSADPLHSYLRKDMAPMTSGKFEDVAIAISPVAALIRKGHALRVAIAGADDNNLERIPAHGTAAMSIEHGAFTYVEIPVRTP